ncbi:MAG: hypothetical protein IKY68_00345 [Alistipes sp.]|nr:hypothetical protein [Alistipes sp.]
MKKKLLACWSLVLMVLPVGAQTMRMQHEAAYETKQPTRVDFVARLSCFFPDCGYGATPYVITQDGTYKNHYTVGVGFETDIYFHKQWYAGVGAEVIQSNGSYVPLNASGEERRKSLRTTFVLPALVGYNWKAEEKLYLIPSTGFAFHYIFAGSDKYSDAQGRENSVKLNDLKGVDRVGWSWVLNLDAQFERLLLGCQYSLGLKPSTPDYVAVRIGWRF